MTLTGPAMTLTGPGVCHLPGDLSALAFIRAAAPMWRRDMTAAECAPIHYMGGPRAVAAVLERLEADGEVWSLALTVPHAVYAGQFDPPHTLQLYYSYTAPIRARVTGAVSCALSYQRRIYRSQLETVDLTDTEQGWTLPVEWRGPVARWRHRHLRAASLLEMAAKIRDLRSTRGQASLF